MPSVRIQRPTAALQSYVTFFYSVEVAVPLTDFLYPEWGNVRFAIAGDWSVHSAGVTAPAFQQAALYGPTDRHGVVTTGGGMSVGFGLTPAGWYRLIGRDAAQLSNRAEPLGDQLGRPAPGVRQELAWQVQHGHAGAFDHLERLLTARLAAAPPLPPAVLAIDTALRARPATLHDFARAAGVTERTLQRLCPRVFGFAPKRILRLQRFLDALGHVRSAVGDPVRTSLGDSYFDQSHFYRDFRDFMGMSPRAYFSAPRPLMAAAAEAQVRAGVTLSFELPPAPAG